MDRDAKGSLLELHREYQKLAKTYNMLTTVDKVKAMIQLMRHGFKGNSKNKKNNAVDSSADNSGEEAAEPILDNMEQVLAAASSRLTTFVQWLRCSFRRYRGSGWHENLSSSGRAP